MGKWQDNPDAVLLRDATSVKQVYRRFNKYLANCLRKFKTQLRVDK